MGNIFGSLFRRKRIVVNFNSDDLREDEKLQALVNENAYLKGKEAKRISEEAKKRESSKDKNEEEIAAKELTSQKKILEKKDIRPFSIKRLFDHKSFKNKKIMLTTFDGKKQIAPLTDIVIMPDGGMGVVSNGKVIWASNDIAHVFYWVAGLSNYARNKIIPLCIDSEFRFTPNLMTEEIEDVVLTSDGKFKINRFNKKPLFDIVADKEVTIQDLYSELKNEEEVINGQQQEIKEKERESVLHKGRADKAESELSRALTSVGEIEKANGEILRQNTNLMNMKDINEDLISAMEKVVKKWGSKIEDELGNTQRDKEWEDLKNKLLFAKQNMPQTIYVQPEKEPKPSLADQFKPVKA